MKIRKVGLCVLLGLSILVGPTGCNRAIRDGVSIGITDGLSDGLAQLISEIVTVFSENNE